MLKSNFSLELNWINSLFTSKSDIGRNSVLKQPVSWTECWCSGTDCQYRSYSMAKTETCDPEHCSWSQVVRVWAHRPHVDCGHQRLEGKCLPHIRGRSACRTPPTPSRHTTSPVTDCSCQLEFLHTEHKDEGCPISDHQVSHCNYPTQTPALQWSHPWNMSACVRMSAIRFTNMSVL
jgi:hypothetical protein